MLLRLLLFLPAFYAAVDEPYDLVTYWWGHYLNKELAAPVPSEGGYDGVADCHHIMKAPLSQYPITPITLPTPHLDELLDPMPVHVFTSLRERIPLLC